MDTAAAQDITFRDSLSIVDKQGKRRWLYPKQPKGRLYNARTVFSFILLLILFGTPFVKTGGHPFMLFNVIERKFILFGLSFGPHDFYLLALSMVTFIVFVILFTVVFGRLFCGWACPQTVFLEMVFRKIEYFIEGNPSKQKQLNASPWNGNKLFKKLSKWSLFFIISFIIANTFLAYIIGIDELAVIVTDPPSKHLAGLISILVFTGAFYWVFAWFREQACILVCPYGRLQSVLLDRNSIVVAYDYVRGEPRGKIKKSEARTSGDCIDCRQCVEVCPTGIDIRNGTQLECVNCTACIDACNFVMNKTGRPEGLIRYDSIERIQNKTRFKLTAREIAYSTVLVILITILSFLLANRKMMDVSFFRTPGMMFQKAENNMVSNVYNLKILNKSFDAKEFGLKLSGIEGELKIIGGHASVNPQETLDTKVLVLIPEEKLSKTNTPLRIEVISDGGVIETINTNFLGPNK
jgi:cytochrome c oxidase accessory protein FixG